MHPYEAQAKASQKHALQRCGSGGSVDAKIAKAVHEHERHDHKGEPLTKMKSGGAVPGKAAGSRLDQRARGGRTKGPARVNIVISTGGGEAERQMAMKQGMQVGAMSAANRPPMPVVPPRPPVVPPGAGGPPGLPPGAMPPGGPPPMGMPPGGPRPPMKRGGGVYPLSGRAGSGGGKGRLEKKEAYEDQVSVRAHTRRRAGGRV